MIDFIWPRGLQSCSGHDSAAHSEPPFPRCSPVCAYGVSASRPARVFHGSVRVAFIGSALGVSFATNDERTVKRVSDAHEAGPHGDHEPAVRLFGYRGFERGPGEHKRAANRQRLVAVALEPFLDVVVEAVQSVVGHCHSNGFSAEPRPPGRCRSPRRLASADSPTHRAPARRCSGAARSPARKGCRISALDGRRRG